MLTIVAFLVTLGVLVTVHEYGHFQMARWCGVKVLRFSVGFGKPLFTRRFGKDQTEFVLAALPLGGYVKMLDERELEDGKDSASIKQEDLPRAFNRQPVWKRMAIVIAGPASNLILAIFLYWLLFISGVMGMRPILGTVEPNSPAAHASLKSGSSITSVAGIPVTTWQDVRWEVLQQTIKASSVEVETLSDANEVHLHQLELSSIGKDDFETDFLAKLGLTPYQPEVPAKIGEIIASGAADKAGLKAGDSILSVNGSPVTTWEELVSTVRKNPGKQLELKIQRGGATSSVAITPDSAIENGKAIGRIGAAYHMEKSELDRILVEVKYSPLLSIEKAARKTWDTSIFSLKMMGSMITGQVSWRGMSGPVTIASYAGQTAHIGWKAFIGFLALVSISLGILNLLPIPVLDGGHLLYYVVEILKGSPVSDRVMEIGQRVGMALLGLLMTCALYNDFNRLITG